MGLLGKLAWAQTGSPSSGSVPTDDDTDISTPSTAPTTPAGGSATGVYYTISFLVDEYFDDLDDKYYEGLSRLTCQGYSTRLTMSDVNEVSSAVVTTPGKDTDSNTTSTAAGRVVLSDGSSRTLTITMTRQSDDKWCVSGETAMR